MATEAAITATLLIYTTARDKILTGAQAYKIGTRQLTRADLPEINKQIERLEQRLAMVQNSGAAPSSAVVFGGSRG